MIDHEPAKNPGVDLLPDEALGHPNPAHRLGDGGGDPAEAFLRDARGIAVPLAEIHVEHPQHRHERQHHQEQHPVGRQHERRRDDHLAEPDHADEQHVLHHHPHRGNVRREPADDPAELGAVVKRHRQPLEMREDLVAHVMHRRFAQLEGQALTEVERELGERCQRRKSQRAPERAANVAAGDRSVDHRPDRPRQRRDLDAAHDHAHKQPVPLPPIRPQVGQQAPDQLEIQWP